MDITTTLNTNQTLLLKELLIVLNTPVLNFWQIEKNTLLIFKKIQNTIKNDEELKQYLSKNITNENIKNNIDIMISIDDVIDIKIYQLEQWIINENNNCFLNSHSKNEQEVKWYNFYHQHKNKEKIGKKFEEIKNKYQSKVDIDFLKKPQKFEEWIINENNNYFPNANEKNENEQERQWYNFYIRQKNNEKIGKELEKIKNKYPSKADIEDIDFLKKPQKFEEWIINENNNYFPNSNIKNENEQEKQWYNFYSHHRNNEKIGKELEKIKNKYPSKANTNFLKTTKKFEEWIINENNNYFPNANEKNENEQERQWYQFYNKHRNNEKIGKELKRIKETYSVCSFESISNNILSLLQELIINVNTYKNTKKLLPTLQQIIGNFNQFKPSHYIMFEQLNRQISDYVKKLSEREEDIESIGVDEIKRLEDIIIGSIQNNETIKGAYIAQTIKNYVNTEEDIEKNLKEQNFIANELYELKSIIKFLKYKQDQDIDDRELIVESFNEYIDNFKIINKEGEELEFNEWHKLEIKSHFITFFEYFSEEDFNTLKMELLNNTINQEEFFNMIIERINNSTINIANTIEHQTPNIFSKNINNQWVYKPCGSGELDMFASYNNKIYTSSSTSVRYSNEGSQLLFHPIKAKLMLNKAFDIIEEEMNENGTQKEDGSYEFNENSIFYGLNIAITNQRTKEVKVNILDNNNTIKPYFEALTTRKTIKMENLFLMLKTLVDGQLDKTDNRKIPDKVVSKVRNTQNTLVDFYGFLKRENNVLETLGYSKIKSKIKAKTFEQYFDYRIQHIFDIPSLTFNKLNYNENTLFLTMYLEMVKEFYAGKIEVNDELIKSFKIRTPFVEQYNYRFVEELQLLSNLGQTIFESINESTHEVKEEELIEKMTQKYSQINKGEEEITKDFFQKLFTKSHKHLFRGALLHYLNTLPVKEKNSALKSIQWFEWFELIKIEEEAEKITKTLSESEEKMEIVGFIKYVLKSNKKLQDLSTYLLDIINNSNNKNWDLTKIEVYKSIKTLKEFKKEMEEEKGNNDFSIIFKNFQDKENMIKQNKLNNNKTKGTKNKV